MAQLLHHRGHWIGVVLWMDDEHLSEQLLLIKLVLGKRRQDLLFHTTMVQCERGTKRILDGQQQRLLRLEKCRSLEKCDMYTCRDVAASAAAKIEV